MAGFPGASSPQTSSATPSGAHRLAGPQDQRGQDQARDPAADLDRGPEAADLERAQHTELHGQTLRTKSLPRPLRLTGMNPELRSSSGGKQRPPRALQRATPIRR